MTYNRWSTMHVAPLGRAQFWSDASREAQMPHTPLVARPERFEAVLTSRGVGAVVFNRIQMAAGHGMQRLQAGCQRASPASLLCLLYLKGRARVSAIDGPGAAVAGGESHAQPGQLFLLDERCGYRIWQDEAVDLLVLAVPLAVIDSCAGMASQLLARSLPDCASLQLLVQQMQLIHAWQAPLPEGESAQLSDLVINTLKTVLQAGAERAAARPDAPMHVLLCRVRQLIARQYPDPALGPERVASRLGLSVRSLQSRLSREGTSLSAELMDYRLERAHALLRAAKPGTLGVTEISQRCGFNSLAHFSRRFRARYGSTPLELLREAGVEGMGSSTWHGDGAGT
ncbi:AraC family transcriptional regulator [Delftia tsuruhatensis]|uniref:AraC family transcriptional regulator n=1 Tax=Delftia tsuruhatensis TaxID=180282 RepID=UPI002444CDB6|nr:AraC family transcriptional regulator [Delftia tsuruhatensis]MDH0776253.1 AraC family transcriptional regulator [Delftia tsuruhatensis]MDH1459845.1 AraC family transcriptional regulator [Delftia tsuruhatensis]MDH1823155.1 AraC family transcriptional regulator [Delftia tsuruhatensis]WGG12595.1 AraC family transcriptional regulator [Delftia tsuruhatensis]